jgi:Zn-dependent peptidase ImmA (M78 family)/DNA-binding XRE family transcriptional regulator
VTTTLTRVNGSILKWGRERAHLTKDQIAKALHTSVAAINEWERNEAELSLSKALDFTNRVHIPFGYLYLKQPPAETLPIPDLRRRGAETLIPPSVNFRDVCNDVILKQQWFRYFRLNEGAKKLPFVGKFSTNSETETVAIDIRSTLHFDDQARREASSASDLLRYLAARSEEVGVLVMRSGVVGSNNTRKLSASEFSGFVMSDDIAPVIFINVNDSSTAQVFTCVHELAHIWLGSSGISALDTETTHTSMLEIEAFCNLVAAEVLVPEAEFLAEWSRSQNHSSVATHFRVSPHVILRRAHELHAISDDEFFRRWKSLPKPTKSVKKDSGGNFHNTLPARNSIRFTTTILSEVRSGRVLSRDASRLLGVKPSTLPKLAKSQLGG